MDIHIDRPTLNGQTTEENMAIIDRWIADTSDKLNAAMAVQKKETGSGKTETKSSGLDSRYATSGMAQMAIYLGQYREQTDKIIMGG